MTYIKRTLALLVCTSLISCDSDNSSSTIDIDNTKLGESVLCDGSSGDSSIVGTIDFYDLVSLKNNDTVLITLNSTTASNQTLEISRGCVQIGENQQLPIPFELRYQGEDIFVNNFAPSQTNEVQLAVNLPSYTPFITGAPGNFDPNDLFTYSYSASAEIFDSLGERHLMSFYFLKENLNEWLMFTTIDGQLIGIEDPIGGSDNPMGGEFGPFHNSVGGARLVFDSAGDFVEQVPSLNEGGIVTSQLGTSILTNGADPTQTIKVNFNLDIAGPHDKEPTQYASEFEALYIEQDGFGVVGNEHEYTVSFYYYSVLSDGSYQLTHESLEPMPVLTNGWGNIVDAILSEN